MGVQGEHRETLSTLNPTRDYDTTASTTPLLLLISQTDMSRTF